MNVAFFWQPTALIAARAQLAALHAWSLNSSHASDKPGSLHLLLPSSLPGLADWRALAEAHLPGWRFSVCQLPERQADESSVRAGAHLIQAHALACRAEVLVFLPVPDASPDWQPAADSPARQGICLVDGGARSLAEVLDLTETACARASHLPLPQAPRPRLAYVSPMPPEQSGIADYSARLVLGLATHFEVEIFCATPKALPSGLQDAFVCHAYDALPGLAAGFDRVAYHVGNSHFHKEILALLPVVPGVVVLHDFFIGGAIHSQGEAFFVETLEALHGAAGLDSLCAQGAQAACSRFPLNGHVLELADGIVVHSRHAADLLQRWWRKNTPPPPVCVVPIGFSPSASTASGRDEARLRLGLGPDDFLLCSFGFLGSTKLNDALLSAWEAAGLPADTRAKLVFVGGASGEYGSAMVERIKAPSLGGRVEITGYTDQARYMDFLLAADCAVQLRCLSRGESSATILDCLAHGLPTLINAHGSAAELPDDVVLRLDDNFTGEALAAGLLRLRNDTGLRAELGQRALTFVADTLNAARVAEDHAQALWRLGTPGRSRIEATLSQALANVWPVPEQDGAAEREARDLAWAQWSACAVRNFPPPHAPRLLLELSGISTSDLRTGIERSTRNLTKALLRVERADLWPEPFYRSWSEDGPALWRANRYISHLCDWSNEWPDEPIRLEEGDTLLMIDTSWGYYQEFVPVFEALRERGGRLGFFVHDLLPLELPTCFPSEMPDVFRRWMEFVVTEADFVVCGSRTSADAVWRFAQNHRAQMRRPLRIAFSHYGADIQQEVAVDRKINPVLVALANQGRPMFLSVGTLEPRKGQVTILDAFELAWAAGEDVALCLIGKLGWMMDDLAERLRKHPEWARRLLWVAGASDAELDFAYRHATGVISASINEGFGLPIIEAAQYGKPVILSDIPIFREVAGDGAAYFPVGQADALAVIVADWARAVPSLPSIPWLTWQQSAENLARLLLDDEWYQVITPLSCSE